MSLNTVPNSNRDCGFEDYLGFHFHLPWQKVAQAQELKNELEAELCPQHYLYHKIKRVLARREDTDDLLLETVEGFALVHLSWCKRSKLSPSFPQTRVFNSWQDFIQQVYKPDLISWQEENPESLWEEQLKAARLEC